MHDVEIAGPAPDVGDRDLDRTGAGHADQLWPKRQHGDRELSDQVVETALVAKEQGLRLPGPRLPPEHVAIEYALRLVQLREVRLGDGETPTGEHASVARIWVGSRITDDHP